MANSSSLTRPLALAPAPALDLAEVPAEVLAALAEVPAEALAALVEVPAEALALVPAWLSLAAPLSSPSLASKPTTPTTLVMETA